MVSKRVLTGLVSLFAAVLAGAAAAQDNLTERRQADMGRRIVQRNCAQCHATGPTGDSPAPKAPKLRDIGLDYPFFDFAEALRHGMLLRHPQMPEIRLTSSEIEAVVAYLKQIQTLRQTGNRP